MADKDEKLQKPKELKDKFIDQRELRDSMDAEVKRVSGLFRFVLKYQRHFQPSGVEFSGLRQYLPSDDASRIDWKNSAGKPDLFVKQYEEELDMDVYILLDVSDTMTFGTADKLKSEYAAIVTAALAYASVDAGIDVGLGLYANDHRIVTPGGGTDQYDRFLDELTNLENYGGQFDLETALDDTIGQIKENTALFIISDFLEVKEGDWKSKLTLCNMKFRHVMTIMTRDLRDYKMPASGNIRFESADGSEQIVMDTSKYGEKFNKEAKRKEDELKQKLSETGSSFLKIDTRDKFSASFAAFFDSDEGEW
jgi:uncharacterized protein (DUF58 family)